jgi:ABC-2 type transport system ATP-binding protein
VSTTAPAGDSLATLAARELTKRFGSRTALQRVSFEVARGEIVAIIGPNGAGKTTLLSILAGILAPSEGEVTIAPGRLGWVPQRPAVYSKLSVAENLRLFARLERLDDPAAAVSRMLVQTGLEDRAGEQVGRLSAGNQQRLNIAVGLLSDPPVVLLDEPSASLDPRQRERLWEFIGGLAGGGTAIVFSTHNVAEVERYATRVLTLVDGELLFAGTPAELDDAVGGDPRDLEAAFVRFLRDRGH